MGRGRTPSTPVSRAVVRRLEQEPDIGVGPNSQTTTALARLLNERSPVELQCERDIQSRDRIGILLNQPDQDRERLHGRSGQSVQMTSVPPPSP